MTSSAEPNLYFPPDIADIIHGFEEGTFRIKGHNMVIYLNGEDGKAYKARPGLWRVQLGPIVYKRSSEENSPMVIAHRLLILHHIDIPLQESKLTLSASPKVGAWGTLERTSMIICSGGHPVLSFNVDSFTASSPYGNEEGTILLFHLQSQSQSEARSLNKVYDYLHNDLVVQVMKTLKEDPKQRGARVSGVTESFISVTGSKSFFEDMLHTEAKKSLGDGPILIARILSNGILLSDINSNTALPLEMGPWFRAISNEMKRIEGIDANTIMTDPILSIIYRCETSYARSRKEIDTRCRKGLEAATGRNTLFILPPLP